MTKTLKLPERSIYHAMNGHAKGRLSALHNSEFMPRTCDS